jgi:hypothetical protein
MSELSTLRQRHDQNQEAPGFAMEIGASEAEPFWTAFLRKLARGGLGEAGDLRQP